MKAGDIVTIYVDPFKCRVPAGEAKLLKLIEDKGAAEYWTVEYVDNKWIENVLIKKEDATE
jgi:hypothetical protein